MDKKNAENLVSSAFNFPFNQSKYSELISNIFKNTISINEIVIDEPDFKDFLQKINQYSEFTDENGKKIHAIEVIVNERVNFDKSRSPQRNFAIYYLKKYGCDSVLISFYNKLSEDWRFSLVTREVEAALNKGRIKVNITTSASKKLSYLVGKNEPNYTAKNQILNLIINNKNNLEDIKNAFSVERVTDDFFNDYKELYLTLKKEIDNLRKKDKKISKDFENNKINSENFAKTTLGQIVFLFFLQKKGWLGIERNENNNFKKWGSGSKTFISELYKKYSDKKIKGTNFYNDILEPIFYDALNNPEDYYEKLDCKMPFLNGGLFEPINGYNWYETDILIKDATIKKILDIFNQYNFTVTEDQPLDREVAVDPEMLGKVFEKLLNEKERKKGGAHYTPREVVQYMCRKSIFYFLKKQIDENLKQEDYDLLIYLVENLDNDLINEFKKTNLFNYLNKIDALLEKIKICDPAIGSGAFPVSMMLEIVNIRNFIGKMNNKETDIYDLKRNFIENNLYGVDIDTSAVDIAKLRLWLSLIVDEKSFEKINPLPNLDYKIIQGNSLVEKIYDIDFSYQKQSNLLDLSNDELSVNLFELLEKYYNTSIRKNKEKLKKDIRDSFSKLITSLIEFSGKKISKKNLDLIKKNSDEIFDEKKERNYFLWNIFFHQIFKKNDGFDLIIANPPYIKEYTDRDAFSQIKDHEYYQGKMDIWYFMTCKSLDLLKNNGVLCFIAQNNWFTNSGAKILRNKIVEDSQIQEINDFSNYMIFDSADQQTMILMLSKNKTESYDFKYSKVLSQDFSKKDLIYFFNNHQSDKMFIENIKFEKKKYKNQYLVFSENKIEKLLDHIEKERNFILKKNELSQGMVGPQETLKPKIWKDELNKSELYRSGEGIFCLNDIELKKLKLNKKENELIKPLYIPEDLQKYYSDNHAKNYVIYTTSEYKNKNKMKNYPNLKKHLDRFKKIITSDNKPYGLHRARNEYFFKGKKILCIRKCEDPFFSLINTDAYVFARFNIIKSSRVDMEYLSILLNSDLVKFYLKNRGKMQGFNFQLDTEPLLKIPIKIPTTLKDYLEIFQKFKAKKIKLEDMKDETNKMIFSLYNISEKEINLIKNDI
jgi:adenine-specific DNA-methyltransferase